jgi:FkbM family methyltransferase
MWADFLWSQLSGRTYFEAKDGGVKLCFLAPYHHLMARSAAYFGIELEFMGVWKLYASKATRIYDIGGFNGVFGLTAAKFNPKATVVIFEPDPINQEHIKKNIELNGLTNCSLEPVAISDFSGTSSFSFDGTTYSMVGQGKDTITCKKLSEYPPADLLKIDAGNSEAATILGSGDALKIKHPLILMQTHHSEIKHREMYAFLEELGYVPVEFRTLPTGKHIVWDPRS